MRVKLGQNRFLRWIPGALRRITGISLPIIGVQWSLGADERDAIRKLLMFLEDRRILYADEPKDLKELNRKHSNSANEITSSVNLIRAELVKTRQSYSFDMKTSKVIESMQEACRRVMEGNYSRPVDNRAAPVWVQHVGRMRRIFGVSIFALSKSYDLELGYKMKRLSELSVASRSPHRMVDAPKPKATVIGNTRE
jgi:hypothetical protein